MCPFGLSLSVPCSFCILRILSFPVSHLFPFSLTYISLSISLTCSLSPLLSLYLSLCLPLCHHPLFLILPRLNPTLSLLQSIYRVCLSIFPWLIVLFLCPPLSSTLSVSQFLLFPLCKSHLFPSLLYVSRPPFPFLCVPDSEPVETKGHGGLTLIDASDRGEEGEGREGWLWADKVNSVFPSS